MEESRTDDDEALGAFLLRQHVHRVGAELGRDAEDGAINLRQVFYLLVAFDALYLIFLGVNGIYFALEGALQQIFQGFAARFVDVTGCTAHHDALRIYQLVVYHRIVAGHLFAFRHLVSCWSGK